MRVVAENTKADIARRRAKGDVEVALRELTSNLIRVARGAGKAYLIVDQAAALLNAVVAVHQVPDTYFPVGEVGPMLNLQEPWHERMELSMEDRARHDAEEQIIFGALQVAASRLVGQKMQIASGLREMLDGVNALERWKAEARAERKKAAREAAPQPKKKTSRRTGRKASTSLSDG